jgi:hypothetical protein
MIRAQSPRLRVTFSSACLATALVLAAIMPAVAAEASPPPASPAVPDSGVASPLPSALAPAEAPRSVVSTKLPGAEAIAAGHGRYVAVGTRGASRQRPIAWVSADGVAWDRANVAGAGRGRHMVAVTPTSDGFVALGYARASDGGKSNRILAWYSSDGTEWKEASIRRPAHRGFDAFPAGLADGPAGNLADGPAGQLALGHFSGQDIAGQRLWLSADGQTWAPTPLPDVEGAIWFTVVAVPDGYLLSGQSGPPSGDLSEYRASNWISTDGVTWAELDGLPSSTLAAAPDGTVVAIGGTDIWRSSDLVEWEQVWSAPEEWASRSEDSAFQKRYGGRAMFGWVDWAGDRFLLTGRDYGACDLRTDGAGEACMRYPLLQSADGRTWTQMNGPDGSVGIDSDTWLKDVASDGVSTVLLDVSGDGPPVVRRIENEPLSTAAIE